MSDYENTTPPSIAYMKQFFWQNMEELFKGLGAETGDMEKRQHEHMVKHVEDQNAMLRALILIERKKLETLIEHQRKIIEAQDRRIKSVEAMFAQPASEANTVDRRLLS